VAVSASGIVYVFWFANSGKDPKLVPPAPLPVLPDRFLRQAKEDDEQDVPGISVLRNGKWSQASWLGKPGKNCEPVGAWCEGEKLHLLVTYSDTPKTEHLLFDPAKKRWDHVATVPVKLALRDPRRQVGKEIHTATIYQKHVHYLRFNGKTWTKPLRLKESKGASRVRLAVDGKGDVHLLWWCYADDPDPGVHSYAAIRGGRIHTEKIAFGKEAVDRDKFDLGLNPAGEVLLAYKARGPVAPPGKAKPKEEVPPRLFFRRRTARGWSEPETLSVPGDLLFGSIFIESCNRQTLVSWVARFEQEDRGGVLETGVRFCSSNAGKGWSAARPCAREGDKSRRFPLMTEGRVGRCIDSKGRLHLAWLHGCHHCVIAQFKGRPSP
jgi:hypothetical protein